MRLAKASDQYRPSDVTMWGMVALVAWGIAVLGANVSTLVPDSVFAGLHASRLEGASINQLRAQVAELEDESQRMRRENALLLQRFTLSEQTGGAVTRRVGALEASLPKLLEALPPGAAIDRSVVTGSLGAAETLTYNADGGSVSVTQTPLGADEAAIGDEPQPIPAMPEAASGPKPDSSAFGLALGAPFDADEAEAQWQSLSVRAGPLLLGLGPLLADMEGTSGKRLVVGPISDRASADVMCGRMSKIGVACATVPFIGMPMPLLN